MDDYKKEMPCNLIMENRKKLSVSGVYDVDNFDESTVSMCTTLGELCVKGKNLHINKLSVDSGELIIEGEIDSCEFSEVKRKKKESFLAKILK